MRKRLTLIIFTVLCLHLTDLFALELIAYPKKTPIGGMNLSKGLVLIRETGEIKSLSSDGFCTVDISREFEQVTVDVFVPGFQAAGGVFDSNSIVEIPLFLQNFVGEELVLDLGESASMLKSARFVLNQAVKESEENPQQKNPNAPTETTPAGLNPFYIIELIVGKSLPEILGMDDE